MWTLPRWLASALLVSIPCFLALLAYDTVAIVLLGRGEYALVPAHDLARAALQDVGLAVTYALTLTPRVISVVAAYSKRQRRICLMMLGLGVAWYDVLCASATRIFSAPPGLAISLVLLFVVPAMLAPWYVRWLNSRIS